MKPLVMNGKSKSSQDELQVRLGFFLENNTRRNLRAPNQSCSSLTSANTSPVSTLTGSSEADVSRVLQEPNPYHTGCESIGSMMSISEQSNASSSPVSRRHSVTSECCSKPNPGLHAGPTVFLNRIFLSRFSISKWE